MFNYGSTHMTKTMMVWPLPNTLVTSGLHRLAYMYKHRKIRPFVQDEMGGEGQHRTCMVMSAGCRVSRSLTSASTTMRTRKELPPWISLSRSAMSGTTTSKAVQVIVLVLPVLDDVVVDGRGTWRARRVLSHAVGSLQNECKA